MVSSWSAHFKALAAAIMVIAALSSHNHGFSETNHLKLGNQYLEQRRLEPAIQELLRAEREGVNNAELFNNLGLACYLNNDTPKAIFYYLKAKELKPNSERILNNLGSAYLRQKDYQKAAACYQRVLKINPEHVKAAYNLAVVYYRRKRYLKAARYYLKAKKLDYQYGEQRFSNERMIDSLNNDLQHDPDNKDLIRALKILKKSP